MAIFVSHDGGAVVRVDGADFPEEGFLQEYLRTNPQTLPFDEIKEGTRVEILAREFPTDSGPIDALGVDQDGNIYVIETKLSRNADKRKVMAQALDYGASLRYHHTFERFRTTLDELLAKNLGASLHAFLRERFNLDEEGVSAILAKIQSNFESGNLRFIIVMDRLDDRLKDLIRYLNEHSDFAVFAVEMSYYKHQRYEIVAPKLFGVERQSEPDRDLFVREAHNRLTPAQFEAVEKVLKFSESQATDLGWGRGRPAISPRFVGVFTKSLYTLRCDGRLDVNLGWHTETDQQRQACEEYRRELEKIAAFGPKLKEGKGQYVGFPIEQWMPAVDEFIEAVRNTI